MNTFNKCLRYATLGLMLQVISTTLFTQCTSLICEDNVTVSMNQACEGTINPYFLIVNQNQCGGPKELLFYQNGVALGDTLDGPSYIGETVDFWVKHKWSQQECWGTVTIVDNKGPQIDCQNLKIKCTEDFDPDSLGEPYAEDNCTSVESMTYSDEIIDFGCGETGFEGYFAPANWTVTTTNGDGGVDVTGAPNSVLAEGANASPFNVTPRYITKFKIVIPAEGYVSFDWSSLGGSNFDTDAFYVTVNDVCIQLSFNDVTSGSYTTWLLEAGDVLSFEQASDGTSDHVNTLISNFQFLTTTFKIINRTWTATDTWGNAKSCTQVIELQRATLSDVYFPPNRDGIAAPMLGCGDDYEPEVTGVPFLDDDGDFATTDDQFEIENNDCTFNLTYSDQVVETCPGSELILREWTILDWCSSQILSEIQVIKRFDEIAPEITNCPQNMTLGLDGYECGATVNLPIATANDACTGQIQMIPNWSYGTGNQTFTQVDLGTHTVTYTATDACGNASSCTAEITILDDQNPTMVCDAFTVAAIAGDGTGQVFAPTLDDGSFDSCCFDGNSFEIKKKGESDATYAPSLMIDCTNLDAQLMVVLRAKDCSGNTNACEVEVKIEDNDAPAILAPNDLTVDCSANFFDLEIYGMPQVFDNCNYTLTETNTENLNNCGQGTITRIWTATDPSGNENTATQTIFVQNQAPWNTNNDQIIWPADYAMSGCDVNLEPSNLPTEVSEPTFVGQENCELVAISHEDQISWFSEPACYLLFRKWTVVDWCQNDLNNAEGIWEYTQTIEVTDSEAPTFDNPPTEILVEINSTSNCTANVNLPTPAVSDCSDHILFSAFGELGSGFSFNNVEAGSYAMTYTAADGCGNSVAHDFNVVVVDSKKPTPVCKQGLVAEIEQDAEIEISASLFNLFSFDNCTDESDLKFSFSANIQDETLLLNCNNLGNTNVEIWVTDEAGNQDLCVTFITLNDNFDYCQNFEATITGNIINESGEGVNQVQISMQNATMPPAESDENGNFIFENMPLNNSYTLVPEKDINPVNGVSTYDLLKLHDHILGFETLDSPYKLIAADANHSGSVTTLDIVTIQRVILVMDDNFTNNTSWRFVPADYEFQNPQNPFNENFPETQSITNISGDMEIGDFIGIKIGDLNGNANPMNMNSGGGNIPASSDLVENRSTEKLIFKTQDQYFEAGETVFAEIIVEDIVGLRSWQGTFEFDNTVVELVNIEGNIIQNSRPIFNENKIEEGIITALWTNKLETLTPIAIGAKNIFFKLEFVAKSAGHLSELFSISSNFTPALAFNKFDEKMEIELHFENGISNQNENYQLFQNFPNPVVDYTEIEFIIPKDETVTFEFINSSGEVFHIVEKEFKKGNNILNINRLGLNENRGVIFYRMNTECFSTTQKMVIID